MTTYNILALGGDGIGPEVVDAGLKILDVLAVPDGMTFDVTEDLLHGKCWDTHGVFIRDETLAAARAADAVLVGAVGGEKWDNLMPSDTPPERKDGLMRLRHGLQIYGGLRPARAYNALMDHLPFKSRLVRGADVMVVRELCGGAFFGSPRGVETGEDGIRRGFDNAIYADWEVERIARVAFELARKRKGRVLSVDKSNVMESYVLWRDVVSEVGAREYPGVELTNFYADNASYQLAMRPNAFDVILGDNLFGDLFSDLTASISGSLGMLPSASLASLPQNGRPARPGLYEPVHGTAPGIAGQGIANPIGMILSIAMMFDYGFALPDVARRIETAVEDALNNGLRPCDLGGEATTDQTTDAIIAELRR